LGTLTVKEKDEIESKFDKALETLQCFFDPTCNKIARGSLTIKNQLERQESYSKIYALTILYRTKVEEGSLDVDF